MAEYLDLTGLQQYHSKMMKILPTMTGDGEAIDVTQTGTTHSVSLKNTLWKPALKIQSSANEDGRTGTTYSFPYNSPFMDWATGGVLA